MTFDVRELRKAFGNFLTGVTVATTVDSSGVPAGFTANSFTSVSLDPPMLLVCMGKNAISYDLFQSATGFAVNVLTESQTEISNVFAAKSEDKFTGVPWQPGPAGNPLFENVAAWFDCELDQLLDGGDHTILLGRIQGFGYAEAEPLGYYRGGYVTLGLERSAAQEWISVEKLVAGAIIDWRGEVLLLEDEETGRLRLPTTVAGARAKPVERVDVMLREFGLTASRPFLYSVYESASGEEQNIYYRYDRVRGESNEGHFIPFGEIPWGRLPDDAIRSMLQRYARERAHQRFGVYLGDEESGVVR